MIKQQYYPHDGFNIQIAPTTNGGSPVVNIFINNHEMPCYSPQRFASLNQDEIQGYVARFIDAMRTQSNIHMNRIMVHLLLDAGWDVKESNGYYCVYPLLPKFTCGDIEVTYSESLDINERRVYHNAALRSALKIAYPQEYN